MAWAKGGGFPGVSGNPLQKRRRLKTYSRKPKLVSAETTGSTKGRRSLSEIIIHKVYSWFSPLYAPIRRGRPESR